MCGLVCGVYVLTLNTEAGWRGEMRAQNNVQCTSKAGLHFKRPGSMTGPQNVTHENAICILGF